MISPIRKLLDSTSLDEDLKSFFSRHFGSTNYPPAPTAPAGEAQDSSLDEVADYLERLAKPRQQLRQYHPLTLAQDLPTTAHAGMQGQHILLFVHGIFGSFPGIFEKLLQDRQSMKQLAGHYGPWMLGWDHWTVTQSAYENAKALAETLPLNAHIDIVCHSRGGLVVRSLLEHPDIQPLLLARGIVIGKVVFVGAAYDGNALASDGNSLLLMLGNLTRLSETEADSAVSDCTAMAARTVLTLANNIQDLPGIDCLSTDAAGYIRSTRWQPSLSRQYAYVRSSFALAGTDMHARINRAVTDILQDASDFVVPYQGAALPGGPVMPEGRLEFTGPAGYQADVHHLNYFAQDQVRRFLLHILLGDKRMDTQT